MKPHIYKTEYSWCCECQKVLGYGTNAREAFRTWLWLYTNRDNVVVY